MGALKPFQLLEINIISAQDLQPISKKMKTYATVWVHPTRKLTTAVDVEGGNNPTWNDKFVFRVDEEFLRQDTSAVQIEIHCVHWFKDSVVGSVRVLVGNLIPPPPRPHHNHHHHFGMRFVALQVRRPSGRPQGILNIGVALLDSTMRSMPLYTELNKSAVGYRDLMEEEQLSQHNQKPNGDKSNNNNNNNNNNSNSNNNNNNNNKVTTIKPILLRTKSERSERVKFDDVSKANSSVVAVPSKVKRAYDKESSILSISLEPPPQMMVKKKGKASSVISGAELKEKSKPKGKKGKAGSVLSDSIMSKESSIYNGSKEEKPKLKLIALELENKEKPTNEKKPTNDSSTTKVVDEKSITKPKGLDASGKQDEPKEPITVIGKPIPKYSGYEFGGPKGSGHNGKFVFGGPIKGNTHHWTDSEIGPSASEVAAAVAEKKYPLEDQKSSVLDGWSLDESTEGLRSKLERWRMELPPVYDRGHTSSSYHSTGRHTRRHTHGSSGLFSCFGNIMGYECQCICGKPKRKYSTRFYSPSVGSRSWF
ncbi:uncharacterized protein [Nicotiana tomentosiformis]|uniref:uncharacterized protein n=1 Tax=Nicotiana tomentosiformis TaxID=4098 RepID=UPI00051AD22F|nr:ankyrin repeat-containing protein kinase A-like [Nicotiana tomentosiformis]